MNLQISWMFSVHLQAGLVSGRLMGELQMMYGSRRRTISQVAVDCAMQVRARFVWWFSGCIALLMYVGSVQVQDVAVAQELEDDSRRGGLDWVDIALQRLPVLEDADTGRWPLVLWTSPDVRDLDTASIRRMLERGIAPTVKLKSDYVEAAGRIRAAGGPVIALEAAGGKWPYDLVEEREDVAGIDPGDLRGWRAMSMALQEHLQAFRQADVTLDAAWLDYENAPVNLSLDDVGDHRASLPEEVATDPGRFRVYSRQLWMSLLSTYVAAPLREAYPRISLTNWVVSVSHPDFPLLDWYNRPHPRTDIGLFTATNPIAYGVDTAFAYNRDSRRQMDQHAVDAVYMHILLRQVSADTHGRSRDAPHLDSIVWVSRVVRDIHDYESPTMTREAYREALRHLWLRGVDAMMVFNPLQPGREHMALYEIEDAAAIYREMLAHHELLTHGSVINTDVPAANASDVFWSGMRSDRRAVVRVTNPLQEATSIVLSIWPGTEHTVKAAPGGQTLIVERD